MALKLKRVVRVENSAKPVVAVEEPKKKEVFEVIDTSNKSINSLMERANDISSKCIDYTVVDIPNNLRFNSDAGLTMNVNDEIIRSPLSRFALSQLGTKIGVPARYLEKCVASGRIELAQDNVNSWLKDYDKDLFIRNYDGRVRGVLSNRYSVCDTPDILDVLGESVNLSDFKIKGSFLSEERLHLRLIGTEMLPIEGEDLFPSIFIDSSDVGRSVLTVQFGIYKQICTNGLVVSKAGGILFQQKHIGISIDDFHTGLVEAMSKIETLKENAVEWVNDCRDKKYDFKTYTEKDFDDFISRIRAKTNLQENDVHEVIKLMNTKYDNTNWGLINGITEVAQRFTLEKRLDLEKVAGNLLVA